MNNGVSQIHKKGKTKLLVDKLFSLGTNKLVGSKLVIKRVIFVFASIQKNIYEHRGHRKGHNIQSAALLSYSTQELTDVCPVMRRICVREANLQNCFLSRGLISPTL